jgi:hypothetical protein
MVRREFVAVVAGLLITQSVAAQPSSPQASHAAFRQAVEDYQMFVVAHCAPDDVKAYVASRADRDRTFVRSLRKTALAEDYEQAVADRADHDSRTVYECMGPPPPPPPPPGSEPSPPKPASSEPQHHASLTGHFTAGDRQFAKMVRLRDELIRSPRR